MNRRSGADTRKRILGAAVEVFTRHGYAGASMREIARAAGVSVGGVYLYFNNKEELYLELLRARISEQLVKSQEAVASAETAAGALRAFISQHLEYGRRNRELILLHLREHGYHFGREIKKKFLQAQVALLVGVLTEGMERREFISCNAKETAGIIMATLRGLVISMAMEGAAVSDKSVGEVVLSGLLCREDTGRRTGTINKSENREGLTVKRNR